MSSSTVTTVICDQCGEKINNIHTNGGVLANFGSSPVPPSGIGWWKVHFAEQRGGAWHADLCSKKCLMLWVDGWREKPSLKVVE